MAIRALDENEVAERLAPVIVQNAIENNAGPGDVFLAFELVAGLLAMLEDVGIVFAAEDDA